MRWNWVIWGQIRSNEVKWSRMGSKEVKSGRMGSNVKVNGVLPWRHEVSSPLWRCAQERMSLYCWSPSILQSVTVLETQWSLIKSQLTKCSSPTRLTQLSTSPGRFNLVPVWSKDSWPELQIHLLKTLKTSGLAVLVTMVKSQGRILDFDTKFQMKFELVIT